MAKASDEEIAIHKLILAKDSLALAKLYKLYTNPILYTLVSWAPKYAHMDRALINEAINEAFFSYSKNPSTYNPDKKTLLSFLVMAAKRDFLNILEREKKHTIGKQELPEDVELEEKIWNSSIGNKHTPESQLITKQVKEALVTELALYFNSETDIEMAKLVLLKVRETEKFSEILEIENLTKEEQQSEIKRHKDRIKKILERNNVETRLKRLMS